MCGADRLVTMAEGNTILYGSQMVAGGRTNRLDPALIVKLPDPFDFRVDILVPTPDAADRLGAKLGLEAREFGRIVYREVRMEAVVDRVDDRLHALVHIRQVHAVDEEQVLRVAARERR